MKEFGRVLANKIFQTITTSGDLVEGPHTPSGTTEENLLEMLTQNWRMIHIEGRNEDDTNTSTFRFYGTRKYLETIPPSGDAFWDVTGVHWEQASADQAAVGTNTNITPVTLSDTGYTYVVVTIQSAVAATETIARAVLTA
jgi:hypothetical protein